MVGEMHGIEENAEFQLAYLKRLRAASGVRDVAIEEDSVYEANAEAFVEGRTEVLSPHLCLRAPMLFGIRKMNESLPAGERIRVHLTDVDSPAEAIRTHLLEIKARLGAEAVAIPSAPEMKTKGLTATSQLRARAADAHTRSDLRTIEYSVRALQDGLEVDIGPTKGSPYLESREQAVASNIEELAGVSGGTGVFVVYGADHVSRTPPRRGAGERPGFESGGASTGAVGPAGIHDDSVSAGGPVGVARAERGVDVDSQGRAVGVG